MFAVNHLNGFNVAGAASVIQTAVAFSGGSTFGNLTFGGNLAACIDGNTNQGGAAAAGSSNATIGYIGYTFPTGHVFSGFKIWGSNDNGYIEAENNSITINFYVKNGVPANATDGTILGSVTFTDTATTNAQQNLAISNTTSYTNAWIQIPRSVGSTACLMAEIQFFEDL